MASCHKEAATVRVLQKNTARKVEVTELLKSRSQGHNLDRAAPLLVAPHTSSSDTTAREAGISVPIAAVEKGQ